MESAHGQDQERHALQGREVVPVRADEQQHAGREHDAAETDGHNHRPARPPPRGMRRFKLPNAIGLLVFEDLRLHPTV